MEAQNMNFKFNIQPCIPSLLHHEKKKIKKNTFLYNSHINIMQVKTAKKLANLGQF